MGPLTQATGHSAALTRGGPQRRAIRAENRSEAAGNAAAMEGQNDASLARVIGTWPTLQADVKAGGLTVGSNDNNTSAAIAFTEIGITVAGPLHSTRSTTFTIESCNDSSAAHEKAFQGKIIATTNAEGDATFTVLLTPTSPIVVDSFFTATAANKSTGDPLELAAASQIR